ncbi:MAG: hypothetical protein CME70_07820 [Halobacteriovorax sp.]|nr:hypothetical protein [Halobacteriovorax sp.]
MRPILFELFGSQVFSYPFFMGLSWGLGYQLSLYLLNKRDISKDGFLSLYVGIFISSWVGSKVLFLISSAQDRVTEYAGATEFWLGGGFVFYGGFLLATAFVLFYTLVLKKWKLENFKFLLPSIAFSHGVGRVGCLLAGCCFGSQCDLPFSIHLHGMDRHPVQLYEALGLFTIGSYFLWKILKNKEKAEDYLLYIFLYSGLRYLTELFRGDLVRGVSGQGVSTSQWIAIGLLLVSSFFIIKKRLAR